jgi:tRNA-2-methylthio-N6-dimethylallyladenosine synthase
MPNNKSVYIQTFGCQMNKADSRRLEEIFASRGYSTAEFEDNASVVIYNTCSVRAHAEQKALSYVGRMKFLKARRPEVKICVVGCMAQRMGGSIIRNHPQVDLVVGPSTVFELPNLIENNATGAYTDTEKKIKEFSEYIPDIVDFKRDFTGYVPVMKGCNNFCSYCIVPHVRGREQYRPVKEILDECKGLSTKGIHEIMLLGQTVNSHPDFKQILKDVSKISNIKRIRFVTSYPSHMDKEIVDIVADNEVLCNYFHIPVQSGSDAVLKKMNRKYNIDYYLKITDYIRNKIPDAAISSDFIVGFPGETEEDFEMTLDLVRQVEFDQCFTFKYSPRPLTRAAEWEDDVPMEAKKARLERLNELCSRVAFKRNKKNINKVLEVYSEGENSGRSDHYKIVHWNGAPEKAGHPVMVKITEVLPHSLKGERCG